MSTTGEGCQQIPDSTPAGSAGDTCYFSPEDGHRGAYIVFDMQDPSQMPVISEPLFQGPHAKVSFSPVMNLEDLQKGLEQAAKNR